MAWEQRGGRKYYYRKKRVGGVVRSVYVPELAAGLIEALTARNQAEAAETRGAIAALRAEGARISACRALRGAVRDLLLAAGFHEHERQWRRRRMLKENAEALEPPTRALGEDVKGALTETELIVQAMFSNQGVIDVPHTYADLTLEPLRRLTPTRLTEGAPARPLNSHQKCLTHAPLRRI